MALGTTKDIATVIDIVSVGADQINFELKNTLERLNRVLSHQKTTLHASHLTKVALQNVIRDALQEIGFTVKAMDISSQMVERSHDYESPSSILFREKMMKAGFRRMNTVKSKLHETGELIKINHSLVYDYGVVPAKIAEVVEKFNILDGMIAAYVQQKDTATKENKKSALEAARNLLDGIYKIFSGIQLK